MVWMLTTRVSQPFSSLRTHAARIASGTIGPHARIAPFSPSPWYFPASPVSKASSMFLQ